MGYSLTDAMTDENIKVTRNASIVVYYLLMGRGQRVHLPLYY